MAHKIPYKTGMRGIKDAIENNLSYKYSNERWYWLGT